MPTHPAIAPPQWNEVKASSNSATTAIISNSKPKIFVRRDQRRQALSAADQRRCSDPMRPEATASAPTRAELTGTPAPLAKQSPEPEIPFRYLIAARSAMVARTGPVAASRC